MTPDALKLALSADLIDELMSRYDHAIFAGIVNRPNDEYPNRLVRMMRWTGNDITCAGLAFGLANTASEHYNAVEQELPTDDL